MFTATQVAIDLLSSYLQDGSLPPIHERSESDSRDQLWVNGYVRFTQLPDFTVIIILSDVSIQQVQN